MTTEARALCGLAVAALGACTPARSAPPAASPTVLASVTPSSGAAGSAVTVRVADHLGFGLRLESLSVRVDGRPVLHEARVRGRDSRGVSPKSDLGAIEVGPGVHDVSVVARVSVACGLFSGPRASLTVRASDGFRVAAPGPAWLGVDLFARAPIARPSELPALGLVGHGLVLGLKRAEAPSGAVHPACAGLGEVAAAACDVEAEVEEARKAFDTRAEACGTARLPEIHRLRAVLDEATSRTSAEGTTNETAMHSQLRALYAESRIRALAAETARCVLDEGVAPDVPIDRACPDEGVAEGP